MCRITAGAYSAKITISDPLAQGEMAVDYFYSTGATFCLQLGLSHSDLELTLTSRTTPLTPLGLKFKGLRVEWAQGISNLKK